MVKLELQMNADECRRVNSFGERFMTEELKTQKEFWNLITDDGRLLSKILLKIIGMSLLLNLCAIVFGIGFGLMVNAVILFMIRHFLYWQPAYAVVMKVLGLQHVPARLPKIPIPWYMYIILLLHLLPILVMFYVGLDMVISGGFLDQNMIYWFIE